MSLNKATRELMVVKGQVSTAGTVTLGFGLTNGASGTGGCTLSDTSLYTFAWEQAFDEIPSVAVSIETAGLRANAITPSTTGCTVQTMTYNGTTKTAAKFTIMAIGRGKAV